ncbi:hypothetical protein 1 [Beihai sobemo-like virus 23]|uniref:hypothetical protein 1 n=1 Tax=Beihai sobemo-like virus 23 TaxID=1922695 RepID=UPI00090BBF19|nr:hypothetical protein 1 [Beihai sobemo-like virus 23]APG75710.1 hypothetical protein 1 [Beihai sobemo-like virus 23]
MAEVDENILRQRWLMYFFFYSSGISIILHIILFVYLLYLICMAAKRCICRRRDRSTVETTLLREGWSENRITTDNSRYYGAVPVSIPASPQRTYTVPLDSSMSWDAQAEPGQYVPETAWTHDKVTRVKTDNMPHFSLRVDKEVLIEGKRTRCVAGNAVRVENDIVLPTHMLEDAERIFLMAPAKRVNGKEGEWIQLEIYSDETEQLDSDLSVVRSSRFYITDVFEKLGLTAPILGTVNSMVFVTVTSFCLVKIEGMQYKEVDGFYRGRGDLSPSKRKLGYTDFNGSTYPTFSGSPYHVGEVLYGIHLSGSTRVNMGLDVQYIRILLMKVDGQIQIPESSSEWLEKLSKQQKQRKTRLVVSRHASDPDYVIVRQGGGYKVAHYKDFEKFFPSGTYDVGTDTAYMMPESPDEPVPTKGKSIDDLFVKTCQDISLEAKTLKLKMPEKKEKTAQEKAKEIDQEFKKACDTLDKYSNKLLDKENTDKQKVVQSYEQEVEDNYSVVSEMTSLSHDVPSKEVEAGLEHKLKLMSDNLAAMAEILKQSAFVVEDKVAKPVSQVIYRHNKEIDEIRDELIDYKSITGRAFTQLNQKIIKRLPPEEVSVPESPMVPVEVSYEEDQVHSFDPKEEGFSEPSENRDQELVEMHKEIQSFKSQLGQLKNLNQTLIAENLVLKEQKEKALENWRLEEQKLNQQKEIVNSHRELHHQVKQQASDLGHQMNQVMEQISSIDKMKKEIQKKMEDLNKEMVNQKQTQQSKKLYNSQPKMTPELEIKKLLEEEGLKWTFFQVLYNSALHTNNISPYVNGYVMSQAKKVKVNKEKLLNPKQVAHGTIDLQQLKTNWLTFIETLKMDGSKNLKELEKIYALVVE